MDLQAPSAKGLPERRQWLVEEAGFVNERVEDDVFERNRRREELDAGFGLASQFGSNGLDEAPDVQARCARGSGPGATRRSAPLSRK